MVIAEILLIPNKRLYWFILCGHTELMQDLVYLYVLLKPQFNIEVQ